MRLDSISKKYLAKWKEVIHPRSSGWGIGIEPFLYLQQYGKDNNIKSVLEFGTGRSTICFKSFADTVITFDALEWIVDSMNKLNLPGVTASVWDNKSPIKSLNGHRFDMAFIDGTQEKRDVQFDVAKQYTDVIFVHDIKLPHYHKMFATRKKDEKYHYENVIPGRLGLGLFIKKGMQ